MFSGEIVKMNMNEKCLLGYLKQPDDLTYNTEILKLHNKILEEKFVMKNILANFSMFTYTKITD